jgi:prolyl-tRNA synthetase
VAADTGAIGGSGSHEFHVLADSGEDALAFCPQSDFAANIELAPALAPSQPRAAAAAALEKVSTPQTTSCEAVAKLLGVPVSSVLKSLLVMSEDNKPFLLLLRGDHELNLIKAEKRIPGIRLAHDAEIERLMGPVKGYLGPVGASAEITIIADYSANAMDHFTCGANAVDYHLKNVNFGRDLPEPQEVMDLRNVMAGDPSPDGQGNLEICRGIEVGHVFQLRTKYSEAMNITYLDESGASKVVEMGCYGIGVSRIVAAAIEQHHDERGIRFPMALAPFQVSLIAIGLGKSPAVQEAAENLYQTLTQAGIEVLFDDRDERMGVMLADQELIGVPLRIVVGDRGLKENQVEVQRRGDSAAQKCAPQEVAAWVQAALLGN